MSVKTVSSSMRREPWNKRATDRSEKTANAEESLGYPRPIGNSCHEAQPRAFQLGNRQQIAGLRSCSSKD